VIADFGLRNKKNRLKISFFGVRAFSKIHNPNNLTSGIIFNKKGLLQNSSEDLLTFVVFYFLWSCCFLPKSEFRHPKSIIVIIFSVDPAPVRKQTLPSGPLRQSIDDI